MKTKVRNEGNLSTLSLEGPIAEHARKPLLAVIQELTGKDVVVDCENVSSINSVGCIGWLNFINGLPKDLRSLRFQNCRSVFLDYANLVRGFLGNGKVETVLMPYVCDNCDHSLSQKMTAAGLEDHLSKAVVCPKCNSEMTCEAVLEDYADILNK